MSSDRSISSVDASLEDVWRSLKHHSKGKTLIETINRLWRKNQLMWGAPNPAEFQLQQLKVTREQRSAAALFALLHPTQFTEAKPDAIDYDIVAVHSRGHLYVIDGRRRINEFNRSSPASMLNVLVVGSNDDI